MQGTIGLVRKGIAQGDLQKALSIFSSQPDPKTATFLISYAWKEKKDINLALSVYEILKSNARPDGYVYTTLVRGCTHLKRDCTNKLWNEVLHFRIRPDCRLYSALLSACIDTKNSDTGLQIVGHLNQSKIPLDLILYTSVMKLYCMVGDGDRAIEIWKEIRHKNLDVDQQAFAVAITACTLANDLQMGRMIHSEIMRFSHPSVFLTTSLIHMYNVCGELHAAEAVFSAIRNRDIVAYSTMMTAYNKHQKPLEAISLFCQMIQEKLVPDQYCYATLFAACTNSNNLEFGRKVHDSLLQSIHLRTVLTSEVVCNALTLMYDHLDARTPIQKCKDAILQSPNSTTAWNTLLATYNDNSQPASTIATFLEMKHNKISLDETSYIHFIGACVEQNKLHIAYQFYSDVLKWHPQLLESGNLQTQYIDFLILHKQYLEALKILRHTLDRDPQNIEAQNKMITMLQKTSQFNKALKIFNNLSVEDIHPHTFISIFSGCAELKDRTLAEQLYQKYLISNQNHSYVESNCLTMLAKCGLLERAETIFINSELSTSSCNAMIHAYSSAGKLYKAIEVYSLMQRESVVSSAHTYSLMFSIFSNIVVEDMVSIQKVNKLYSEFKEAGIQHNEFTTSAAITMFGKCGKLSKAEQIFMESIKSSAIYNSMIAVYVHTNEYNKARSTYEKMKLDNCPPTALTFSSMFGICGELQDKNLGTELYIKFVEAGIVHDYTIASAISMFTKFGDLCSIEKIFSSYTSSLCNINTLNAMIAAYHKLGYSQKALELFNSTTCTPNDITYATLFRICAELKVKNTAVDLYTRFTDSQISHTTFTFSAAISMLINCDLLNDALNIFEIVSTMPQLCTLKVFNEFIYLLALQKEPQHCLNIYSQLKEFGLSPDVATYLGILKLAIETKRIAIGSQIHKELLYEYDKDEDIPVLLVNSLITMYFKCGAMESAKKLFNIHVTNKTADFVTWNSMVQAHGMHGQGKESLKLFEEIKKQFSPDAITFTCILSACSHSGLVEDAISIYQEMQTVYGIEADEFHHACMVDVLGRAGRLKEAEAFILSLKHPTVDIWKALLGASHNHQDIEIAKRAAKQIFKLDSSDAAVYVLLANTYEATGDKQSCIKIWDTMKMNKISKIPGITWLTVNGRTEQFYVDDNHPQKSRIIEFLTQTKYEITKKFNYLPDTSCVLQPNMSDTEKLERLWLHSEKLALAWALISMDSKEKIIMHKNLRVCKDCHLALKFISKLYQRSFVIGDANRFHHFEDGKCSCNDYW